jgi:hypothetical protein
MKPLAPVTMTRAIFALRGYRKFFACRRHYRAVASEATAGEILARPDPHVYAGCHRSAAFEETATMTGRAAGPANEYDVVVIGAGAAGMTAPWPPRAG